MSRAASWQSTVVGFIRARGYQQAMAVVKTRRSSRYLVIDARTAAGARITRWLHLNRLDIGRIGTPRWLEHVRRMINTSIPVAPAADADAFDVRVMGRPGPHINVQISPGAMPDVETMQRAIDSMEGPSGVVVADADGESRPTYSDPVIAHVITGGGELPSWMSPSRAMRALWAVRRRSGWDYICPRCGYSFVLKDERSVCPHSGCGYPAPGMMNAEVGSPIHIADLLGLRVSLAEAYCAYSIRTGIQADRMSETDRRWAVLDAVRADQERRG